jgi:hypothetical protein
MKSPQPSTVFWNACAGIVLLFGIYIPDIATAADEINPIYSSFHPVGFASPCPEQSGQSSQPGQAAPSASPSPSPTCTGSHQCFCQKNPGHPRCCVGGVVNTPQGPIAVDCLCDFRPQAPQCKEIACDPSQPDYKKCVSCQNDPTDPTCPRLTPTAPPGVRGNPLKSR